LERDVIDLTEQGPDAPGQTQRRPVWERFDRDLEDAGSGAERVGLGKDGAEKGPFCHQLDVVQRVERLVKNLFFLIFFWRGTRRAEQKNPGQPYFGRRRRMNPSPPNISPN
jgi:hypothetical protein